MSAICECDLRYRRWNPNTGRCETCRRNYRSAPPFGESPVDHGADEISEDGRAALALLPHVKQVMDTVRPLLPEGTDFGVFVLVPGSVENRVIAITTDRQRVGLAVAQWFVQITNNEARG